MTIRSSLQPPQLIHAWVKVSHAQIVTLPTTPVMMSLAPPSGWRAVVESARSFLHLTVAYTNINTTYAAFILGHTDATIGSWEAQGPVNDNTTLPSAVTNLTDWLGATPFDKVQDLIPLIDTKPDTSGADLWALPSLTSDLAGVDGLPIVLSMDNNGSGILTGGDPANYLTIDLVYRFVRLTG